MIKKQMPTSSPNLNAHIYIRKQTCTIKDALWNKINKGSFSYTQFDIYPEGIN